MFLEICCKSNKLKQGLVFKRGENAVNKVNLHAALFVVLPPRFNFSCFLIGIRKLTGNKEVAAILLILLTTMEIKNE